MTPEEAAWVREHAWTQGMRKTYAEVPGFYLTCACQRTGPCINSRDPGRHARCHVGRHPLPDYETWILWPDGRVCAFPEPYQHPTAQAVGWHYERLATVWLADRRCAWRCACDCGHPRTDVGHAPENNPARPIRYETVALPGLEHLAVIG